MSATGSNFGGNLKSGLKGILSNVKSAALSEIRSSFGYAIENLKEQFKVLRPVYKVMITVPTKNPLGVSVSPQRYIIADTSRPYTNFMGKGDSPVLGIWIDQSDITEPDKAIVLMYNPTRQTGGIFEQDITNFKQYGVRNWLDIWLGYSPSIVGSALVDIGGIADRFGLGIGGIASKIASKVPFTFPDPFFFGNESHVFSGPIVSIKRHIKSTGDRVQIIGFSPIIALRQSASFKFSFPQKSLTVADAVKHIVEEKVVPFSIPPKMHHLQLITTYKDSYKEYFWMGHFTHRMFTGGEDHIRVAPINTGPQVGLSGSSFFSNPYNDGSDVETKLGKFKLSDKFDKKLSLYDLLFTELTEPTKNSGLVGLYAFVMPAAMSEGKVMDAFNDGTGHPGVFIKYGFKFEIEDIGEMIKREKFGPMMRQRLTLGMNAKEFEGGIEYGTVFNTRQVMVKDEKVDGAVNFVKIPTDPEVMKHLLNKNDPFWNSLMEDIVIYGETVHPIHKWLYTEMSEALDPKDDELDEPLKHMMRRSYFTGMSGSVFAIGKPAMKPGRILKLDDVRGTGLERLNSIVTDGFKEIIKFRQGTEDLLPALKLKGINKEYYVWKVRHYLGVGSGYVTKVYFAEERNRSWQVYTRSIDQIIRKALAQSKDTEV